MGSGTISIALVQPVFAAAPEAARARLFAATGIRQPQLEDPDARVTPACRAAAWRELARITGRPAIALDLAAQIPVGAFGVVEYLCRSQPDLGDALRQWTRYLNILDDAVVVGLVDEADAAHLRVLTECEAPAPAAHELCFAVVVRQARELCGDGFAVRAVAFAHPAPDDPTIYEAWFGAPVRFEAPRTELTLDRAQLSLPVLTANEALAPVLARHAEAQRAALEDDASPLLTEVRRAIRVGLQRQAAGVEDVAATVGMPARTLQRRLREEEATTFSELREQTRRALAQRYLGEALSVSEISFLLGFSEASAFQRAFKRWTGHTPLEHRARLAS